MRGAVPCRRLRIEDRGLRMESLPEIDARSSILDPRITVGKLIRKSAGVKLQKQPVRIRPQPPILRSGVTGNTLGSDPRDSRFDPWLRSLRTWPSGSGTCLRNKTTWVRVLPSALEVRLHSSADKSATLRTWRAQVQILLESPGFVLRWSSWL